MTDIIINNQLLLLVMNFALGILLALGLLAFNPRQSAWIFIDTMWVVFGGSGIFVAVTLGLFQADASRVNRQIDVVYATNSSFIRDTRLYRLKYCEDARGEALFICNKVNDMSTSAQINETALPVFFEIDRTNLPLRSQRIFDFRRETALDPLRENAPDMVLMVVDTRDGETNDKLAALSLLSDYRDNVAEYEILADTYDTLVKRTNVLLSDFAAIQKRRIFVTIQVLLLSMVALFLPLRAAKGWHDYLVFRAQKP